MAKLVGQRETPNVSWPFSSIGNDTSNFKHRQRKRKWKKYKVGGDIRLNSHRGIVTFVQAIDTTIEPSFGKFCHKRYICKIYESIFMQSRVLLLTWWLEITVFFEPEFQHWVSLSTRSSHNTDTGSWAWPNPIINLIPDTHSLNARTFFVLKTSGCPSTQL